MCKGILVALYCSRNAQTNILPILQREMFRFELEVKYMRKDCRQLFRLFFMSFVMNSVTALVCLAEERHEDTPVADIVSAYVVRGYELYPISVLGQPSTTFSYQGFTASVWGSFDTKQYPADTLNIAKIFVRFGLDTVLSPTLTIYNENNNRQWSALFNISHTY